MASIRVQVKVDLGALHRFGGTVSAGLSGSGAAGALEDWRKQAAARISAFETRRFNQYSRGGGDWPALAISTIRARRKAAYGRGGKGGGSGGGIGSRSSLGRVTTPAAKAKYGPLGYLKAAGGRTVSILVDTGILKNAVSVGGAGNSVKRLPNGLSYGFNYTPHMGGGGKSHPTIGQLAAWHQTGAGNLPVRVVLGPPDAQTVRGITGDLQLAVNKVIAQTGSGGRK